MSGARLNLWIVAFGAAFGACLVFGAVALKAEERARLAHGAAAPLRQCLDLRGEQQGKHPGMVWVPAGDYVMGDDVYLEEGSFKPVHVSGFWMDRHEVTNMQFAAFVKATGYVTDAERIPNAKLHPDLPPAMRRPGAMVFVMPKHIEDITDISQWWHYIPGANWRHPAGPASSIAEHENFPVVEVTYNDAMAYARWTKADLPTEAEWEWAARGADPKAQPVHDQPRNANTWQGIFPVLNSGEDGFVGLAPAGCYQPNRLGLYDVIGNVWEWTKSVFTRGSDSDGFDPASAPQATGGATDYTIKGGSFLCSPNYCMRYRSGAREPEEADLGVSHLGFRTVLRAPQN